MTQHEAAEIAWTWLKMAELGVIPEHEGLHEARITLRMTARRPR